MKSGKKTWFSRIWTRVSPSKKVPPTRTARRRAFFLESLEERRVMDASLPVLNTQTVYGGSPLFMPLNGTSTISGAPLTYTVSSSNPSLVDAFVLTGNRSAKISVANFGDMTFELFDNYVPEATNHFIALASGNAPGLTTGFYNDTATNTVTFHRVINNFVIQAGDPTGTGSNGSILVTNKSLTNNVATLTTQSPHNFAVGQTVSVVGVDPFFDGSYEITAVTATTFSYAKVAPNISSTSVLGGSAVRSFLGSLDDQFNVNLQHNRTGLLSMAKTIDDSNDTQFFITEGPQRHLDFQHSIFGILTTGESVRDAISNVQTTGGKPNTDVVISSVSIFNDLQNRVLGLKAANGASGEADITVTVSDGSGTNATRTFHVIVAPDVSTNPDPTARAAENETRDSKPFILPITTPRIVAGAPGTFQIPAVDVEGDAIYYDANKIGSVNYSLSIDHNTGVVTVTPPAGFVGTLQVQVAVKKPSAVVNPNSSSEVNAAFDLQTIDVVVGPAGPTGIDLQAASDSGSSNSDNITNASTLRFDVSGVVSGDTVRLFADGNLVGTVTASGTTATIETSSIASMGQGAHQITASRISGGVESVLSAPLTITYDTTSPAAFTTIAPTTAIATQLLTYDANSPEEGTTGFVYSLSGAPQGAAINATTGVVTWTPTTAQTGSFQFSIIASDAAGNATNQAISLTVAPFVPPLVDVQLSIVDANGNPLTQIPSGGTFFLVVKAKELGDDPRRVIAIYNDITFDSTIAQKNGDVAYADRYDSSFAIPNPGGFGTPGLFNELGSTDLSGLLEQAGPPAFSDYEEVYRIPMKALRGGTLTISADPADDSGNETLVFGKNEGNDPVGANEIAFHSASIQVLASFTPAADNITNVQEDSTNNTLNVLANDLPSGSTEVLTIIAVGTPNHGGVVTIAPDGKSLRYTPANNFDQTETFTYTVQNSLGEQAIANVTVVVQPTNDPPVAGNDTLSAIQGQAAIFDVLANDNDGVDTGETLTISSVVASSNGATVTVVQNGTRISYTAPANFSGTDTFTYTISDGHGGTATATATVTVATTAHAPVAVADTLTVSEDSTNNSLNVLSNDTDIDSDTLTIVAVGSTDKGGTVRISDDKKSLIYTPAPNFQGQEKFTYTITDGSGQSTAQIVMNVTNVNDPPQVASDSATTYLNSTGVLIDVLANDSTAGDPGETLAIASLSTPAHGTASIDVATGKVRYIPAAGFTGTDSFTYVVTDGQLTSQGTVNITVSPYLPTYIAGHMFFDANHNGVQDPTEGPLVGVSVTLTGTDATGAAVNKSVLADALGVYQINNVIPGNYLLTQAEVPLTNAGAAIVGSLGGGTQGANQIGLSISAEQSLAGSAATDYNFTEAPQQASLSVSTGKSSMLAKRVTSALSVAVNPGSAAAWLAPSGTGWSSFKTIQASLSADGKALQLTAVNSGGVSQQVQVATSNNLVRVLDEQDGMQVLQLRGEPTQFGLSVSTSSSDGSSSGSNGGGSTPLGSNQPPVNNVPSGLSVASGGTLTFSGSKALSISDPDAGSQPVKVTLTSTNGTLSLATLVGLTFSSGSGTASSNMTFTGTVSAINSALNGATYKPTAGFTGTSTVQITTNDQGNSGTGGAQVDIDSLAVAVTSTASGEGEGEGASFASLVDQAFNDGL